MDAMMDFASSALLTIGSMNAVRARIEDACDVPVLTGRGAHDGGQLGGSRVGHDPLHGLDAEAAVLGVEHRVLAARVLQDVADPRSIELEDEGSGLELPVGSHALQGRFAQRFSPVTWQHEWCSIGPDTALRARASGFPAYSAGALTPSERERIR